MADRLKSLVRIAKVQAEMVKLAEWRLLDADRQLDALAADRARLAEYAAGAGGLGVPLAKAALRSMVAIDRRADEVARARVGEQARLQGLRRRDHAVVRIKDAAVAAEARPRRRGFGPRDGRGGVALATRLIREFKTLHAATGCRWTLRCTPIVSVASHLFVASVHAFRAALAPLFPSAPFQAPGRSAIFPSSWPFSSANGVPRAALSCAVERARREGVDYHRALSRRRGRKREALLFVTGATTLTCRSSTLGPVLRSRSIRSELWSSAGLA